MTAVVPWYLESVRRQRARSVDREAMREEPVTVMRVTSRGNRRMRRAQGEFRARRAAERVGAIERQARRKGMYAIATRVNHLTCELERFADAVRLANA